MFKIAVYNKISNEGLCLFSEDKFSFQTEDVTNADGIILRSAKLHDIEFSKNLKAIARAGAGVNNIPVDKCSENGIVVFNTPGANANGVMELTILGMLLSSRKITEGINWTKTLKEDVAKQVEKGKGQFKGPEIKGKTIGVIGLGAIGVLVANTAIKLGMNVIGYDPYMSVKNAIGVSWDVDYAESLDELLSKSDYISLHIPLIKATTEFINKDKIAKMKNGVRLLNFSRGCLVNDDDIIEALESEKISKYVTDFPNEKILNTKNTICIPHLGASTPESEENCARMAAKELIDYIVNGNITNSVNLPNCSLERIEGTERITVINKNVPNMIGSLTGILAKYKINIIEMVNKSKGDYAYNIIDVKGCITEEKLDEIRNTEGILSVMHIK